MANSLAQDTTGTLSRLISASRSLDFRHPGHLRNRTVPAQCLGSSESSQSCRSPEQYWTGDLCDEMWTVKSEYTACIGSEDLPPNTHELYRLAATLAEFAATGSHKHPFTPTEASNAVRCLDQYVRETASETEMTYSEISRMDQDTRLFRLPATLGEFSGYICTAIRAGKDSLISTKPWTVKVPELDKEEEARIAWEASDQTSNRPCSSFTEALQDPVNDLQVAGWNDLDMEIALLAVRSYARRAFIAHSKAYDLDTSNNFQEIGQYLEDVDKQLEVVLPDEEMALVDKYRRIIAIYRDKHIRKNEWKDVKTRAGQTASDPTPSNRPSHSAIRSSMEMGKFRPLGLAGRLR